MQVEIKQRKCKDGRYSLYLEYYETGFRKRENLRLYIQDEAIPGAKKSNKKAMEQAQAIRAERILNPPKFEEEKQTWTCAYDLSTLTWMDWIDKYLEYSAKCSNNENMLNTKNTCKRRIHEYLKRIHKVKILLKDVDKEIIRGLYKYLTKTYRIPLNMKGNNHHLQQSTLVHYQEIFRAIFNYAIREGALTRNPINDLAREDKFHAPDIHREYLTPEELTRLLAVKAPTPQQHDTQHAFVFSSMTGLRYGDVKRLRWSNIVNRNGVLQVSIVQQKTKHLVVVPLNDMAISVLPPRPKDKNDDALLFPYLPQRSDGVTLRLQTVAKAAGIDKEITFHCSRHTSATLAITAGSDLYTVSKILGHTSTKATQVYAKVDLATKMEAVNLTDGVFT